MQGSVAVVGQSLGPVSLVLALQTRAGTLGALAGICPASWSHSQEKA